MIGIELADNGKIDTPCLGCELLSNPALRHAPLAFDAVTA
jgi:hypothetical protein